jgi:hypothetical protein
MGADLHRASLGPGDAAIREALAELMEDLVLTNHHAVQEFGL